MSGWMSVALIAIGLTATMADTRIIPAEPVSVMLDTYGDPIMFLREKRMAVRAYPQRAMMFTGYYRPVRRSDNGDQATGVFAQGNAVSGETFLRGTRTPHLANGPRPIDEPEVSSAEAQAAPVPQRTYNEQEQEQTRTVYRQQHHQQHHHRQEEQHHAHRRHQQEEQHRENSFIPQEPEGLPLTTEMAQPAEGPIASSTEASVIRSKVNRTKKIQKRPIIVDADDEGEDEDDEEYDEPVAPFVPFKGDKRRQGYPNLNNFFPMVFSFPRMAARAGSSDSPPGTITAIANSYSTGKGGVASSVATAYGGSPAGKKRRAQTSEE